MIVKVPFTYHFFSLEVLSTSSMTYGNNLYLGTTVKVCSSENVLTKRYICILFVVVLLYLWFIFFLCVTTHNHLGRVYFSCGASDFYTRNIICWPSSHQKRNCKYTIIEILERLVWRLSWNSIFFSSYAYITKPLNLTRNKIESRWINLRIGSVFWLWIVAVSLIFLEHPHLGCSLNDDFFQTLPIEKQIIKEMLQCKIEFC